MNDKALLTQSLTLLYREISINSADRSIELVKKVTDSVKVADIDASVNSLGQALGAMKDVLIEICGLPQDQGYAKQDILQRCRLAVGTDDRWYEAIQTGIDYNVDEKEAKRDIVNIRNSIKNHFKEKEIAEVLSKASLTVNFKRETITNISGFITEVVTKLEALDTGTIYKDPAIVDEVDLMSPTSMTELMAREQDGGDSGVYRLGWKCLNRQLQGGLREGEFANFAGLQHKYKTGYGMTVFRQVAVHNKPKCKDPTKKPMLLRISFEDKLAENMKFLYQLCKYNEVREYIDIRKISTEEMTSTIQRVMTANGWHIKMIRMDPTQCTYKSIVNKILEYEAEGYHIEGFFPDYLGLVPTTGCITTGPIGTDMRDLIRRIRNFFSSRRCFVFNPHQLSTDAKGLIRGGIPEDKFVKEIDGKGYYAGSKQLDQEFDLEQYIHLFHYKKKAYLTIQRGKHRLSSIIEDDKDKYFIIPFPYRMPIPDDLEDEDQGSNQFRPVNAGPDDTFFA